MSEADGSELPDGVRTALMRARPRAQEGLARRVGLGQVLAAVLGTEPELPAIGRFVIEAKVGAGGMGVVYRAHDPASDRPVAIKLLVDDADAERFFREAKILADLRHPAIVSYVAHGRTVTGEPYLAMEWLEGQDLDQRFRAGGLTVDETVQLAARISGALAEAHDRGVVHRDLKPANVFIPGGRLDQAKLLDFGVARAGTQSGTRLTRTGALVGTPSYMSPEQVRGDDDIDGRADVFALGCVIYESLIGRPVFVAEHLLGVLARILFQEPPRISELRPEVPAPLDELVARMLEKDREGRPTSTEVIEALRALGHVDGGAPDRLAGPPALSTAEKRVVSVVLAHSDGDQEEPLRAVARRFGVSLERVTRNALVAALSARGPAIDQAAVAARLALAMKEVVAGAPIVVATGRGVAGGTMPVGDAIDRGAHLLEHFQPGVWLDEVTAALLEGRFEIDEAGGAALLVGEHRADGSSRTLLGRATPFVGRDHELALLDAALAGAVDRPASRAVLVTAPSGIGKSRLASEWSARVGQSHPGALLLSCRGEPMSAGASLLLAAQLVRGFAGTSDSAPAAEQREALSRALAGVIDAESLPRIATFLGEILGLPVDDAEVSEELGAARTNALLMGDQIRLAWEDWLDALAGQRPVVLVIEDLHWGDAPSVKLLDTALRNLRDRPLFVLALARPEVNDLFPSLWSERGVQTIALSELSRRASEDLARAVLGADADPEVVSWIGEQAGGHALYLEEVIRAAAEGDREVPASVLAMVQVRLAALSADARQVLRAASVFGEVFWRAGVAALVGRDEAEVAEILEDLTSRETISRHRRPRFAGHAEYSFRHALFRDAAEAMLTDEDAVLGHRLAAGWLLAAGERQPRVLAEHFDRGEQREPAVEWYARAAEDAMHANDFEAAIQLAGRGLALGAGGELLGRLHLVDTEAHIWCADMADVEWSSLQAVEHLLPGSARWYDAIRFALTARVPAKRSLLEQAIDWLATRPADDSVLPSLVMAAVIASEHLSFHGERDQAWKQLERAEAAAEELAPGDPAHAWILRSRSTKLVFDGRHDAALPIYLEAARRFEELGDLRNLCTTKIHIGWLKATALGMPADAIEPLQQALELAERVGLPRSVSSAKQNLAVALMHTGRLEEAQEKLEETVEEFERASDRRLAGGSRFYLTTLHTLRGDLGAAEAEALMAIELAREVPTTRACSLAAYARALLAAGRNDEALERARQSAAILEELGGIEQGEALIRLALAEAQHACGATDDARGTITAALTRLDERAAAMTDEAIKQRFYEHVPEHARILELAEAWG